MRRALVVDDDADIRLMISAVLRGRGWGCEEADSGATALAFFPGEPFDLVVLDYKMPDLTGFDVALKLRDGGYEGPILLYSAYVNRELEVAVRAEVSEPLYFVSKTDFGAFGRVIEEIDPSRS